MLGQKKTATAAATKSRGHADSRPAKDHKSEAAKPHVSSAAAVRETIESVVIAFVLAFLFRTFEAEAFVIPTGSMAPTLMGRHKEVTCPQCGYTYQVSASDEVDEEGNTKYVNENPKFGEKRVVAGTCPMCRFAADLGSLNTYPSYKGDRILVGKFAYDFSDPHRWDVAVFHWPENAQVNFIKRIIGLPGETIQIYHGDIFTSKDNQAFEIARKPPEKLRAMLQPVFDNDFMPRLAKRGWPQRWEPAAGPPQWQMLEDGKSFSVDGDAAQTAWLAYRHRVPSYPLSQFAMDHGAAPPDVVIPPQLILDFAAYNTNVNNDHQESLMSGSDGLGLQWVGDLALNCTVETQSAAGELVFALIKGGRQFACTIDVASGQATLSISGSDMQQFRLQAPTALRGPGKHSVLLANCDQQLRLWIDGRQVLFGGNDETTWYPDLNNCIPQAADLDPVRIGAHGVAATVSHLQVSRDIYYIATKDGRTMYDFKTMPESPRFYSTPGAWSQAFGNVRHVEFPLGPDQFLMLGDNSAKSKDSRLWNSNEYYVRRDLLIGKALVIYWPHSLDNIFPFCPNFPRMGFVR